MKASMLNLRLKESFAFLPVLIAYSILYLFYPFLTKAAIIKFILFQLLFLLLPGYIFSKWLVSEELTKTERLILGYPVSMVVIFILSWTGRLLRIGLLEAAILPFTLISIYRILKDRRNEGRAIESPIRIPILFYGLCLFITFRIFILPSAPPTPGYLGLYYQDSLATIDNTWAYIRAFPLEHARFSGVPFGYHILQNIFQATAFKFTKIDPFYIHFYLEPVFDWFILVFIIFYGGVKIAKFSLREIVIFLLFFFFTNSFLGSGFQSNSFINPISMFFGLPIFALFVFCITSYLNNQAKLDVVYLSILFIYFTATKATLGIITPLVFGIIFILRMIKRQASLKELWLLSGFFLGAIFLKLTIFQNTFIPLYCKYDPEVSKAYQLFKQIGFIKEHLGIVYPIYRFFSDFLRILLKFILNAPVLLFLTLVFVNGDFRRRVRSGKEAIIFIAIFFMVSIIMGSIFVTLGGQVYYIWYAQVVFLLLGVLALEYILNIKGIHYKLLAVALIILSVVFQYKDLKDWVKVGWGALPNEKRRIWDARATIDYYEWQAMEWLKQNTQPADIFFSDRRYFSHESGRMDVPRFWGYSALSGRRAFAEGESDLTPGKFKTIVQERWDLINKFLASTDLLEQVNLLKDIPADYFIQSLRFNKKDFSGVHNLQLIYENKSIKIFKILRNKYS